MKPDSSLPPGAHAYGSIMKGLASGRYRFAPTRSASGRLNPLIGISPEQLRAMAAEARRAGVGLILHGSRVSGPRARQRTLHPVLKRALPLTSSKRTPSQTYPGVEGVTIEKSMIKELGLDSVHTSDLTVFLVDPRRPPEELLTLAGWLELRFRALGCSFPIKVFPGYEGHLFREEAVFQRVGVSYLKRHLPPGHGFSDAEVLRAFKELYTTIGLPQPPLSWSDALNGAWNAVLASISFSIALKFHPVIPAAGFAFGLLGRRLARARAWIADRSGDTVLSNTAALAFDAAVGAGVMACLINPAADLGLPLGRIAWTSCLHTLSKGSVRLFLDKRFSRGTHGRQAAGVMLTSAVNFLQGLTTAYVYAGSSAAVALHAAVSVAGLLLVYQAPLRRLLAPTRAAAGREAEMTSGSAAG